MSGGTPEAGTYRLDGMLQGPATPGMEPDFEAWARSAKTTGLHLHMRMEGGSFSFVADPLVKKTSSLKEDLESAVTGQLDTLLGLLPERQRNACFSTLRSEEFRPGTVIRTLYSVGPDGRIKSEQRAAETETAETSPEITTASLRRAILPGLVGILLVLFVSTFFIDYRQLFSHARERLAPLKKEELVVVEETGGDYLDIELLEVDNRRNALVFEIRRGPAWNTAMNATPADAVGMEWPAYTTLLAIRQGRFRIELHDKERKLLGSHEIDVRGLLEKESVRITVIAHSEERIAFAVLRP